MDNPTPIQIPSDELAANVAQLIKAGEIESAKALMYGMEPPVHL